MATDIAAVIRNLVAFHDFTQATVIHVGAGGGQFVGYAAAARRVLAVDPDADALDRLMRSLEEKGLTDRFQVVRSDLMAITAHADVVFFEFCLHEIPDPTAALRHALTLAPQVLVVDPAPGSPWAWTCGEEDKVVASWAAVTRLAVVREALFEGVQRFHDFAELHAKLATAGELALQRIEAYRDRMDFTIPMPYRMAVVARG